MRKLVYLKDVVTLRIDEAKCTGCGMCLDVCPHEVLKMNGKCVQVADRDACMECGACRRNCPKGAIFVEAGVGCAAAVINGMLGRDSSACCCSMDPKKSDTGQSRGSCC